MHLHLIGFLIVVDVFSFRRIMPGVCTPLIPTVLFGALIPAMGSVYVKPAESSRPFRHLVLDDIRRDYSNLIIVTESKPTGVIPSTNPDRTLPGHMTPFHILRLGCAVGLGSEGPTPSVFSV